MDGIYKEPPSRGLILNVKNILRWLTNKLSLKDKAQYLVIFCIAIYAVFFSYYTIAKHYSFHTSAWDLGGYEQILWSTIHHRKLFWGFPDPTNNPTGYYFGVHFSPILFLVLPIYAIFQVTETLLVLQSFVLALAALPLYWLARDELDSKIAGIIFVLVYLLYPPLHGVNWFDFHIQTFLPVTFLLTFYYFKKEKWTKYFIFLILALSVSEAVPPIVVFMGLYGLWSNRRSIFLRSTRTKITVFFENKAIFYSIVSIALGIIWFIVALEVIHLINPPLPFTMWEKFGTSLPSVILNILSNPLRAVGIAFTPPETKFFYIVGLLAPVMFLSLLDPPSLLIATPWIVASMISSIPAYYTPVGFQYPTYITPFIFISAIYGVKHLTMMGKTINLDRSKLLSSSLKRILVTMLVVSIICSITLSPIGIGRQKPQITFHDEMLNDVIELIPPSASVSTQNNIFPHLSRRLNAYPYPMSGVEYLLVDTRSIWYSIPTPHHLLSGNIPPTFGELISELASNGSIGLLCAGDGIYLFKKGYVGSPIHINTSNHGLWAKFYQDPQLTGLFADSNWGTFNGATEEWYVDASNVSVAKLDAKNETCVQLNTTLPEGKYIVSVRANDTNQVTNDFRFGIWNSEDQEWHTNRTATLSPSFNIHELEFEITEDDVNKQICFLAMKETAISNTIYIDWASIKPLDSTPKTVVLNVNWDWSVYSPFPGMIKAELYGIIFEGYLYAPQTGDYSFILHSDDSSRLYIDDEIIIKNPWKLSFVDNSKTVHLEKGFHKLRIHYANFYNRGNIRFSWKTPWNKETKIVSYKNLYLSPQ